MREREVVVLQNTTTSDSYKPSSQPYYLLLYSFNLISLTNRSNFLSPKHTMQSLLCWYKMNQLTESILEEKVKAFAYACSKLQNWF